MVIFHLLAHQYYLTSPYQLPTNQITLFEFLSIEKWSFETNKIILFLLIASLSLVAIGVKVRSSLVVSNICYLLFMGNYLGTAKSPHMSYVWHSQNLIAYFLLVLLLIPSTGLVKLNRRGLKRLWKQESFYWEEVIIIMTICAAYFGSGYSKIQTSGFGWADGYTMQGYMFQRYLYSFNPFAEFLVKDFQFSVIISWLTLAMETFIPFLLFLPRVKWLILIAFFMLHLGIKIIMEIDFIYSHYLVYLTFFFSFPIETLVRRTGRRS